MPVGIFAGLPMEVRLQIVEELCDDDIRTLRNLRYVVRDRAIDSVLFKEIFFDPNITEVRYNDLLWEEFTARMGHYVHDVTLAPGRRYPSQLVFDRRMTYIYAFRALTRLPHLRDLAVTTRAVTEFLALNEVHTACPAVIWPLAEDVAAQVAAAAAVDEDAACIQLASVEKLTFFKGTTNPVFWARLCPNVKSLSYCAGDATKDRPVPMLPLWPKLTEFFCGSRNQLCSAFDIGNVFVSLSMPAIPPSTTAESESGSESESESESESDSDSDSDSESAWEPAPETVPAADLAHLATNRYRRRMRRVAIFGCYDQPVQPSTWVVLLYPFRDCLREVVLPRYRGWDIPHPLQAVLASDARTKRVSDYRYAVIHALRHMRDLESIMFQLADAVDEYVPQTGRWRRLYYALAPSV
ncbi:hypothetical protein SPI_02663 [Niveomyces insectorum RCEF 264]|uniref:Uncharacterized protein n=1 Tax=Niveomyces insectorum RCEF 264 TaxID=1081102 RepID=A0A167Y5T2_9HYPO|nr:hypothetical protein SPI_02663 [Niveomyces insectorum RCEF 264]